ncbi:MAG: lytic transglycosylase domain-containing protein [Firmicutes bacterium]|jgi:soluble lytic murein transglycosylase|nr:lytic transglycosylase domain-containing protein [Bacillota bacterium]MDD4792681.1 lytic transglycosylase domain-containing protein [Bacillota bacterium]
MIDRLRRLGRAVVIMALLGVLMSFALQSPRVLRLINPLDYVEPITVYADMNEIDPFLVAAIIRVESRYRHDARSSKGACGLMQIMPETGEWAASQLGIAGYSEDMLLEPETNIMIGAWYYRYLLRAFHGEAAAALAAYNGGPSNVERWLSAGTWSGLAEDIGDIPYPETARYVQRVLNMHRIYHKAYHSEWPGHTGGLGRE